MALNRSQPVYLGKFTDAEPQAIRGCGVKIGIWTLGGLQTPR